MHDRHGATASIARARSEALLTALCEWVVEALLLDLHALAALGEIGGGLGLGDLLLHLVLRPLERGELGLRVLAVGVALRRVDRVDRVVDLRDHVARALL